IITSLHTITTRLTLVMLILILFFSFFFFNATPTTEIYTLSLHDALPIYLVFILAGISLGGRLIREPGEKRGRADGQRNGSLSRRSEEHTSELQSPYDLVCRLLLEKKKKKK